MEGSVEDLGAPPESWEVADLDASVTRLMLSSSDKHSSSSLSTSNQSDNSALASTASASVAAEDVINSVDQFLREALQNPRERLSVLRMEQDVEKFLRDPSRQQMEFQQLPTSYLRLAAHRVAQHYSLQSMVLLDNSLPDGSGSRIIVRKTSECWRPLIRLADIPVNLPTEETGVGKVAIKQRPQRHGQIISSANSHSTKSNSSKSVEERKEEYNRARARIFNSNVVGTSGMQESELRAQDNIRHSSLGLLKVEDKPTSGGSDMNIGRGLVDSSASSSRSAKVRIEREPFGRSKSNNRVAIFRDREVERKDPDYDRSYERYMQRFDPGFGFNGGPYTIHQMYSPALNYNTEFPQIGSSHRPPISAEHQPRPIPAHLSGPWPASLNSPGIGYGPTESIMAPFNPNHVGPHPNSALFLQSTQYHCQSPGMLFVHPHEQVQLPFSQAHQQQPDTSFGLARPR